MNLIKAICFLLLFISLQSCQKVITVDLNSSAPRYVVEANISNNPGPYTIKITKSVNFDQDNNFPGVRNAQVYIKDVTANVTDTLSELTPGNYQTHALSGIPGHSYSLTIKTDGNTFTATSVMPQVVSLDSLYTQKSQFSDRLQIVPVYQDPVGTGNYYHLVETVRDTVADNIFLHNDELMDGNTVNQPLFGGREIKSGFTVKVALQCIDHGVFTFYSTLQETMGQNSATPANPQSNISGGALGYFSAYTETEKVMIVQ
jgi:hypothetical protein